MISTFLQGAGVVTADVSSVTYFAPILAFLIVFVLMFALLRKTKILGEFVWVDLFTSFIIASIFITAGSVRQVVLDVIPWAVVLVIALFFMLVIAGFLGKTDDISNKGMAWVFVIILIIIFLIAGIKVFSGVLFPYLPGAGFASGGDPDVLFFLSWVYSPRVIGGILLIVAAAVTSWVLLRYGGKK